MPAKANSGRSSFSANQTTSFFFVSGFGSGAYSEKLFAGTGQRLSGFSQPRQCGDEVLRMLVTGGPPNLGGGYAERLIGSIRRECLDHVVVFSERHLRHLLLSYMKYYNGARTHLSLEKDAPVSRAVDRAGHILCRPILGGLHHQYARI